MALTKEELCKAVSDMLGSPIWEIGEDNDGQLIIYTGLSSSPDHLGRLTPLPPVEEND
tara:strand:- start:2328 stop:2501 length:174 start_codon:yes stop_codon:yes gene_type:complete